jgi:hypothetical protein
MNASKRRPRYVHPETSITKGSRLLCQECGSLRPVTRVSLNPYRRNLVYLDCGHIRHESLPGTGEAVQQRTRQERKNYVKKKLLRKKLERRRKKAGRVNRQKSLDKQSNLMIESSLTAAAVIHKENPERKPIHEVSVVARSP